MDYVLIKNGKVVVGEELMIKDVLIGNDKVILVEDKIERPDPETPVIDAGEKWLMPGAIDTHILFSELIDDADRALKRFNQTQVLCGTTTLLEPLFPKFSFAYQEELEYKKQINYGILADYGFHLSFQDWKLFGVDDLRYVYSHEGIASLYLQWPLRSESEGREVKVLLKTAAAYDILVFVELREIENTSPGFAREADETRESIAEHFQHLKSVMELAVATGCRICILNISFKEEVEMIIPFLDSGLVYAELMIPYHIGTSEQIMVDDDANFSGFPMDDKLNLIAVDEIWAMLKHDTFLLSRPLLKLSEHGVMKEGQVDNRPDEYFLLKNFLSVLYTVGVQSGQINFNEMVDIIAQRIARLTGLYPQKGVVRVGADADLVIWDPHFKRNLYCHFPSKDFSQANSFMLEGRVEFVFIKGQMAYNGESFSDEDIKGRYLYRSPSL